MRILFCDDDPVVLQQLQAYVAEFFGTLGGPCPALAAYQDAQTLLQREQLADIAFLDVEMPGITGIQLGAQLKERNPNIKVFIVTSYPDYLDEAMRFQVFRYLSKPVDKDRLFRNLKDALYQLNLESREFPIATGEGLLVKRAEQIVCVETAQRRTLVYTTAGVISSTDTMEHWRSTLTLPCFFATHRSYLVNMRFVTAIARDKVLLSWEGGQKEAFLTRRKFTQFKDTYLMYLESVQ